MHSNRIGEKMSNTLYQPMECPVCGKFFFSDLPEGDDITRLKCSKCGWRYDYSQAANPDLRHGKNAKSVNEYRQWYQRMIADDLDYDYSEEHCLPKELHQCPVCGKHQFKERDSFDICPICGWVDDGLMEDEPDRWAGNSNDLCLNDFRKRFLQGK